MANTASRLPNKPGNHKHSKGQGEAIERGQLTIQDDLDIRTSEQLQGLKLPISLRTSLTQQLTNQRALAIDHNTQPRRMIHS